MRLDNPIEELYQNMIHVHSGIRLGLETIIKHLEGSKDTIRNDIPSFVGNCLAWNHKLSTHHKLEEEFIFPILNRKMDFSGEQDAHDLIHDRMDKLEAMLYEVKADHSKFNPDRIREHLLATKEPLFAHLDSEVEHLEPEKVRNAGVSASELAESWRRAEEAIMAGRFSV